MSRMLNNALTNFQKLAMVLQLVENLHQELKRLLEAEKTDKSVFQRTLTQDGVSQFCAAKLVFQNELTDGKKINTEIELLPIYDGLESLYNYYLFFVKKILFCLLERLN